jgi:hypothetical protein
VIGLFYRSSEKKTVLPLIPYSGRLRKISLSMAHKQLAELDLL